MSVAPTISLAIVNHNGAGHLRESLPSVLALDRCFEEILLLDNASTDDSIALFERLSPRGTVVRLSENRSPGAARNAGFRAARSPLVLFMDNDVMLEPDCPERLARALLEHPLALVAAPCVVYAREPQRVQFDGADCHFLGHMVLRNEDVPLAARVEFPATMGSLVTACFMIAKLRWRQGELFDVDFPFYYEDHDFALRARLAGHELHAVPAARVRHGTGTPGLSFRPGGSYGDQRVRTLISGRWQSLIKNFSLRSLIVLGPCLLLYELCQLLGALKKRWFRLWALAFSDVVRLLPSLLRKRRTIQSARRVPDRALLRGGRLPFKPELAGSGPERIALDLLDRMVAGYWSCVRGWL